MPPWPDAVRSARPRPSVRRAATHRASRPLRGPSPAATRPVAVAAQWVHICNDATCCSQALPNPTLSRGAGHRQLLRLLPHCKDASSCSQGLPDPTLSRRAGHRQLLRLLLRLRPAEHAAHFDLLGAAAVASPGLAAAYLAAAPGAEPRPGLHWQATSAALGRCVAAAAAGQAPLLLRAQRRAPVRHPNLHCEVIYHGKEFSTRPSSAQRRRTRHSRLPGVRALFIPAPLGSLEARMASSLVPRRNGRGCRPGAGPALRVATHAARCRACELGLVRAQAPRATRHRRRPGAGAAAAHLPSLPPQGARALRRSAPGHGAGARLLVRVHCSAWRWHLLHGVWRSQPWQHMATPPSYPTACVRALQGSQQA